MDNVTMYSMYAAVGAVPNCANMLGAKLSPLKLVCEAEHAQAGLWYSSCVVREVLVQLVHHVWIGRNEAYDFETLLFSLLNLFMMWCFLWYSIVAFKCELQVTAAVNVHE